VSRQIRQSGGYHNRSLSLHNLWSLMISSSSSWSWSVKTRLERSEVQTLLNGEDFLPPREYGDRIGLGRQAQGIGNAHNGPIQADDPRLTMTYAEFPLDSFDILLDAGLKHFHRYNTDSQSTFRLVDIGSGLGRIVLYAAMSRGTSIENQGKKTNGPVAWQIHGIECASLLHQRALLLAQEGEKRGVFELIPSTTSDDNNNNSINGHNSFSLHLGPAQNFQNSILCNADLIFAYSTAFSAKTFSPEMGALILDPEWSGFLGQRCQQGCVAITTDRALDPRCGWKLLERIEVGNPDVFGSVGYIHILAGAE